ATWSGLGRERAVPDAVAHPAERPRAGPALRLGRARRPPPGDLRRRTGRPGRRDRLARQCRAGSRREVPGVRDGGRAGVLADRLPSPGSALLPARHRGPVSPGGGEPRRELSLGGGAGAWGAGRVALAAPAAPRQRGHAGARRLSATTLTDGDHAASVDSDSPHAVRLRPPGWLPPLHPRPNPSSPRQHGSWGR